MGNVTQHRKKAEHHLEFLNRIPDEYPGWLAIVAFYEAVERVEMLCAIKGEHSTSHEDRKQFVRQHQGRLKHAFQALYNASITHRYQTMDTWLDAERIRTELIGKRLHQIRSFVNSVLPDTSQEPKPQSAAGP